MLKSVEAIIEKYGVVHLKEPIHLTSPCRAIVTILDEKSDAIAETALLNETTLSKDWSRPEEDEVSRSSVASYDQVENKLLLIRVLNHDTRKA